jgi:hypothetical protein
MYLETGASSKLVKLRQVLQKPALVEVVQESMRTSTMDAIIDPEMLSKYDVLGRLT